MLFENNLVHSSATAIAMLGPLQSMPFGFLKISWYLYISELIEVVLQII